VERDEAVQRDIHELFTRSAGDLLDHWFETDAVKALHGFDAVVGTTRTLTRPAAAMCCCTMCSAR